MNRPQDVIRVLAVEMIEKANSGHPGIALGASDILYALYRDHLKATPTESSWFNRDRFVLAAGHGSSMLYSMLHLMGYDLSIDDLKEFRQKGSITPGHPEYGHTDGVDATSGPLGQGIAMATGMALAESYLSKKYNKEELKLVDFYTYVLCGDGDLQEGITQEAMSLAGHLELEKLIILYDSNDIQLDGEVNASNSENVKAKYESMNFNYILVEDGNDADRVSKAIEKAKTSNKPTIIECKTKIGYKSNVEGTSKSHGSPLSKEQIEDLKNSLGYNGSAFEVEEEIYDCFRNIVEKNDKFLTQYNIVENTYKEKYPELYEDFLINFCLEEIELIDFPIELNEATRVSSGKILKEYSLMLTDLIGGSADLTSSTHAKGEDGNFSKENRAGRNICYGVREHAMGAIANGISLIGLKTFTGAFFVFSDYMKPAMRMASLMKLPTIFVFSHDSLCVGEDGPTHQPVEQLTSVRTIPNMNVFRPANANETAQSWKLAIESTETPSTILLTRQNLKNQEIESDSVSKGAYIISEEDEQDEISFVLIASGSEVNLALEVKEALKEEFNIRVVSMPCTNIFDKQDKYYQENVLTEYPKFVIEMASSDMMFKYADFVFDLQSFGMSAPLNDVLDEYGFTVENIVDQIYSLIKE